MNSYKLIKSINLLFSIMNWFSLTVAVILLQCTYPVAETFVLGNIFTFTVVYLKFVVNIITNSHNLAYLEKLCMIFFSTFIILFIIMTVPITRWSKDMGLCPTNQHQLIGHLNMGIQFFVAKQVVQFQK